LLAKIKLPSVEAAAQKLLFLAVCTKQIPCAMAKPAAYNYDGPRLFGHPAGLIYLFSTELWASFAFYGMQGILVLFFVAQATGGNPGFGWTNAEALSLFGWYAMLVYVAAIPGGLLADRWLGQKRGVLLGGILLCIGLTLLALQWITTFYAGLAFIILGAGCLKPNISAMVGSLYRPGDGQRDVGFTLFYIGINIGTFLGTLLIGWIGSVHGWRLGFGLAGLAMLLGLAAFLLGQKHLPGIGEAPSRESLRAESNLFGQVFQSRLPLAVALAAFLIGLYLLGQGLWGYGLLCIGAGWAAGLGIALYQNANQIERGRLRLLFIALLLIVLFWGAFEQTEGLMNLYAQQKTNRMLGGFELPAPWFLSLNPFFIILLGIPIGLFWLRLKKQGRETSSIFKIAIGIIIMGWGFLFMTGASIQYGLRGESAMYWLAIAYLFHTVGELCASPVAMSFITKLAPVRYGAIMMGFYFAAIGLGNKLAGVLGELAQQAGEKAVFTGIAILCTLVGLLVIAFLRPLKALAHGAEDLPDTHFEETAGYELADMPEDWEDEA
jgi:proton-dependent oligopeptide transporter, POT family